MFSPRNDTVNPPWISRVPLLPDTAARYPVIADVTRPDSAQRAVDETLAAFGRIDVLVNALGDSIRKPLVALPDQPGPPAASDEEPLY